MPKPAENKAVILSQKLYQRLLAAYPKAHRQEYGPAMAQLFRDQCHDAWRQSRGWGLTKLWLHVLPDLVKTSVLEHLLTLKERKSMIERIGTLLRPRSTPFLVFLKVFIAVFVLVVVTSAVITFILPDTYASTVRVVTRQNATDAEGKTESTLGTYNPYFIRTEFETIQSEAVLGKVIETLNLNPEWSKKFGRGNSLRTSETSALLRMRMDLRPVRNTSLIEIRVYSEDPAEAANIANAIAEAYRDCRQDPRRQAAIAANGPLAPLVEIVDRAVPIPRPVRPNKPLNIFLGIVIGGVLAVGLGTAGAVIALIVGQRRRRKAASS